MKPKDAERSLMGCVRFQNECKIRWSELRQTDDPKRRECGECSKSVFWCENAIEAGLRIEERECIAVPAWVVDGAKSTDAMITIGRPDYIRQFKRIEEEYLAQQKNTEE